MPHTIYHYQLCCQCLVWFFVRQCDGQSLKWKRAKKTFLTWILREKGAIIFIMFNWIGKRNITTSKTNRSTSQAPVAMTLTLMRRKTVNDVSKAKEKKSQKNPFHFFMFRFECIAVCFVLKLRLRSYDNEHRLCQTHVCCGMLRAMRLMRSDERKI